MQTRRQFYDMLEESQWWSADKLVTWQRQHLLFLLNHARSSSPFYRYRLNPVFRSNGGIDWQRWHEIPILTRGELSMQFGTLLSTAPIADHGPLYDAVSSGSTGHPVRVRSTRWMMEMVRANNWRAQKWAGLDWAKPLLLALAEDKTRRVGDELGGWGPPWDSRSQKGRAFYCHYGTSHSERLELMAEKKVSYHATSAYSGGMTAEHALAAGINIHLDALLARGGAVTGQLRDTVQRAFGAEVVESYGSKEAGALAHALHSCQGLHVNAESVLVEIVDGEGIPVAAGQPGRLVVTPFASTALPLIRYDQGDIAVWGTPCSCGRGLPVIASISGRERSFFHHPDGRKILRDLPFDSYRLIGAGQIQVAQVGPTDFEVRYTRRDWGSACDEAAFIALFRDLYFSDASVTFAEMSDLPAPSGKFLSNVLEWLPSN